MAYVSDVLNGVFKGRVLGRVGAMRTHQLFWTGLLTVHLSQTLHGTICLYYIDHIDPGV